MIANALANEFISENIEQIRTFLREHSLELTYGKSFTAAAGEPWQWAIHNIYETEPYFLSSRVVKQLLIKLKRGKISAKEVVEYSEKYGKCAVKKTSTWDTIK